MAETVLAVRAIYFGDIATHNLIKLLQANYVRDTGRRGFAAMGYCYVHAKSTKSRETCLRIDLRGDLADTFTSPVLTFHLEGHATAFQLHNGIPIAWYEPYFARTLHNGQAYLTQVKPSRVTTYTEPLYALHPSRTSPAQLDYHHGQHPEDTRGKILSDFALGFCDYLAQYGITATQKERQFTEFVAPDRRLDWAQLGPIGIVDIRLSTTPPLATYVACLERIFPLLSFMALSREAAQDGMRPLLVIEDAERADFAEDGFLAGQDDPYPLLYGFLPRTPKQTVNINPNTSHKGSEGSAATVSQYLTYDAPNLDNKEAKRAFMDTFATALNELCFKDIVINAPDVRLRLPKPLVEYVFLRKRTEAGISYETVLFFRAGKPSWIDATTEQGKEDRDRLLHGLGIDWDAVEEHMLRKYRRERADGSLREMTRYDLVFGTGLCVEIETLPERVLYDYDAIMARLEERSRQRPLAEFKLAPQYDAMCERTDLIPVEQLLVQGLLGGQVPARTGREQRSLQRYDQLQRFDEALDVLLADYPECSFDQLTREEPCRIPLLQALPDITPTQLRGWLLARYQSIQSYKSPKGREVLPLFTGIWYDETDAYVVGATTGFQFHQPRAHLVRRFDVYFGREDFIPEAFLEALAVQFVRLNQYTVLPYPFHLIEVFVSTIGHK